MTMAGWHPLTKLLLLLAVLAVPYLLWTMSEDTPVVVQARRAGPLGAAPAEAGEPPVVEPRSLPPLQTFAAVVERPLFTPSRRLVRPVELPPSEPEPELEAEPAVEEEEPAAEPVTPPELRFFGTVRRGREVTALVTREGAPELARLGVGDEVEEWTVKSVSRDRLVLDYEGQEAVYRIFGGVAGVTEDGGEEE